MRNDSLPHATLYATSARLGGTGLDSVALESSRILREEGLLKKVIAYENRQDKLPASMVRSLRLHPVRLLSFLESPYYYGAKRQYVDWIASRELPNGYDFFHGWSGDCLKSLRVAKERGIPSMIEVPTWHRNKGKIKPDLTASERKRDAASFPTSLLNQCLVSRQRVLEEYDLADLIFVQSEKAVETFLVQGFDREKIFRYPRCVDAERFRPAATRPELFRVVFVGALIKRKGVHVLLEAWHRLNLKNAELLLVGKTHAEMEPYLEKFRLPSVRLAGFTRSVVDCYQSATLQVYVSECEGSAKATCEAASCGLAQISTREAGDIVVSELNGLIVPPNDVEALAAAALSAVTAPTASPDCRPRPPDRHCREPRRVRRAARAGRGRSRTPARWR